jgi:uncharacterized membrane protein
MVPEAKVIRMEMSVPEAIKYVISLGAILPDYTPPVRGLASGPAAAAGRLSGVVLK